MFPSESLSDCLDKLFYHGLLHRPAADSYCAILQTFAYRLQEFECTLGLYFSKRGITGDVATQAKRVIYDIYRDEKRFLVVLTLDDLDSIGQGRDFLEMFEEKMIDIRFQRI